MVRSPFYRLRNISWLLLVGVFLVAVGVSAYFLAAQAPAQAKFEGKWNGKYVDDQRETGAGEYEFHEDKNGQLTVTVTWGTPKNEMKLAGERLGHDTLRMEGAYDGTSYRYIGGMAGDELKLHYESFDKKTEKAGFGLSRLTRPTK